ncbi:cytochrome b/b6 domain-containing protein [Zoogloea sp.]|uniref:cytochrome b/b6 domain-containing protein n=1 Tax=Zoogloea sp. TaxID=49181 RepID=UPI0035B08354
MNIKLDAPLRKHPIWDLPLRLFHWLLVASVGFAYVSGHLGGNLIEWHARAGFAIIGLVSFRLVWGLVGSPTARFSHFVRGPAAIRAYLRGEWRGVGHNPLGALSVLALLALVASQAGSGLFSNDDIAYQGPLAEWVGKEASDRFHSWHALLQQGLLVLIGLHVGAVLFYLLVKRENLIRPMITGHARSSAHQPPGPPLSLPRRLAGLTLALGVAAGATAAAAGYWLPEAPQPAPASTAPANPGW